MGNSLTQRGFYKTQMLWQILIWVLVGIVCFIATKEFITWFRLKKFAKQGFATYYFPMVGNLFPILEGMKTKNGYSHYVKLAQETKGKPGIAMNNGYSFSSNITLFDIDVVREFLSIEHQVCLRSPFFDLKTNLGFLMETGERAFHQRAVLSTIFHRDNLNRIAPEIYTTVQKRFESAKITKADSEDMKFGVHQNSQKFLEELMTDFTQNLVYPSSIKIPKSKAGLILAEELNAICEIAMSPRAGSNLSNFLFLGLPHYLNLLPGSREAKRRGSDLQRIFEDCFSQRQRDLDQKTQAELDKIPFNIIDAMLLHNNQGIGI